MTIAAALTAALSYAVRPLTPADLPALHALCLGNTAYYAHTTLRPTTENLRADLTALPPGKTMRDKHFLGLFDDSGLLAALDVITSYPAEDAAWVGWLILRADRQGQGLGSAVATALWRCLAEAGYTQARLAVLEGNEGAWRFWQRQGFYPDGESQTTDMGVARPMTKRLTRRFLE